MRRTHYTAEIRVLLCESCGAPLQAPLEGGAFGCSYCGVQNLIKVRDDRPASAIPNTAAPVDEATRLARLRSQDGQPMIPPESIRRLLTASNFNPAMLQEAFAVYQATRKEVLATGSPEAAERLYFLTIVANNHYSLQGAHEQRRALLETSLDVLYLPRHKQVLRCMLATAAAKDRDLQAAEQWLAPCDPRAADLESDSAYRHARAFIDTFRGNFRAVIEILGHRDDDIPIIDARDAVCAVLRANALEKLGDPAAAIEALRARMGKENAQGRLAMEQVIAINPELALCPRSFPEASRAHTEHAAEAAAGSAGGTFGLILAGVGSFMLVLAAILVTVLPSTNLFEAIIPGLGPGIGGIVLLSIGLKLRATAREAGFLRRHGIPAQGVIVAMSPTGTRINNVPVMEVQVTVKRPDRDPYQASFRQLLPPQTIAQLQPGVEISLRVHPDKPDKIVAEMR